MLHTRDAQGYRLQGVDVVHERAQPKYPLRDPVKLCPEVKQKRIRSRSTRGTLASRLQQSRPGLFNLKRQGSMLILSKKQRREGHFKDKFPKYSTPCYD